MEKYKYKRPEGYYRQFRINNPEKMKARGRLAYLRKRARLEADPMALEIFNAKQRRRSEETREQRREKYREKYRQMHPKKIRLSRKEQDAQYYLKNKDKYAARKSLYAKARYKRKREEILAKANAFYAANKERYRNYGIQYRKKQDPVVIRDQRFEWRSKNRAKLAKKQREKYQRDPRKILQRNKSYRNKLTEAQREANKKAARDRRLILSLESLINRASALQEFSHADYNK
jgi:hypothetical protein